MRPRLFCLLGCLALTFAAGAAGTTGAQAPLSGEAATLGDPGRGAEVFRQQCRACHKAETLARHLYPGGAEGSHGDVCVFLQTHGLTDKTRDCDIVAYLKVLARQEAE